MRKTNITQSKRTVNTGRGATTISKNGPKKEKKTIKATGLVAAMLDPSKPKIKVKKSVTFVESVIPERTASAERKLTKNSVTYNGMVTNSTSLSACVDMYFLAGASRTMKDTDILKIFRKALAENALATIRLLFWARDVRGGAGERHFFRVCLEDLKKTNPEYIKKNYKLIPEYGRWDDLFTLEAKLILPLIKKGLVTEQNGLLAKWLPRKGEFANTVRKYLGYSPKQYRKLLVSLSNTVEQLMCAKNWNEIEYSHVPSVAMNKYRKAFGRNDNSRFSTFITKVIKGEEKINASAIFPHMLFEAMEQGQNAKAIEAQWMNLPNYMEGSEERIIPVCDVSGSMEGLPMAVSVSLGLYISERNESIFKDAFITFSSNPEMQFLKGTLSQRMNQLKRAHWTMNTNLTAVFDLILNSAKSHKVSKSAMPTKILVISDMEFDSGYISAPNETVIEMIKRKYNDAGYSMPGIIFWNVNGRVGNVPASAKMKNVGLVSGFSPSILTSILAGKVVTPEDLMLRTINSARYLPIEL